METLRVSLLGGFSLETGTGPLPPIPSRVGRSLFAYLVLNRHRAHPREELAARFWSELTEGRARRRLSQTLWQVQDALSEVSAHPYLDATADKVAFDAAAPYWLDVEEFESCVAGLDGDGGPPGSRAGAVAALERAVELYRGDLLSGFYDDWVLVEQERLRQRYLAALDRLVHLKKARSDYEHALHYARRITNQDPLREEAHREVMRLSVLLGRPSDALRQYERCRSVLAEELGHEPAAATTELYEKVARQRGIAPGSPVPDDLPPAVVREEIPFVGRDRERGILLDRLEQALDGRGGTVLVEGEPGVGKSRLVLDAADGAQWRGFTVLWGACHELVSPYEPVAEAVDVALTPLRIEQLANRLDPVWLQEVARVIPRLRRATLGAPPLRAGEDSHRMREAFTRLILEVAAIGPTLVVIEDVHWADDESLALLETLASRVAEHPLVLVATYRAHDARERPAVWDAVRALDRRGRPDRLLLAPLTTFGVAELARDVLGARDVPPGLAARLHRETGGNPLFVLETLEVLREHDGGVAADDLPLPRTIAEVISQRIAGLGEGTRAVAHAAALCGPVVDLPTLQLVCEVPAEQVLAAVDVLVQRGLLVGETDGSFAFGHDQVRRVVDGDIDDDERVALHRRLASAIERTRPAEVDRLAYHHLAGDVPAAALRYLTAAAERAESLCAYETAVRRYEAAVDLLDRVPIPVEQRYGLLAAYERTLDVLGRREAQARVLGELTVLAGTDPQRAAEVCRRRAMLHASTDRFAEAEEEARLALDADPASRGASLMTLGTILRWSGRVAEAAGHLEEAVGAYPDDLPSAAEACLAFGAVLREVQRYPEARRELEAALVAFEQLGDLRGQALVHGALGTVAMETGASDEAEAEYRRAIDLDVRIGFREAEGRDRLNFGNLLYPLGRVVEALDEYAAAGDIFASIGHGRGEAMVRLNAAALRVTVLGDLEAAEADATAALSYFQSIGDDRLQASCLGTLGDVDRQRGDLDAARDRLEAGIALVQAAGDDRLRVQVARDLAATELAAGDPERALAAASEALDVATGLGLGDLEVELRALRARALLELRRAKAAVEETTAAVSRLRRDSGVLRSWLVHDAHHRALEAVGRKVAARHALELAYRELAGALAELEPQAREAAIRRVPEHRAIAEAWAEQHPGEVRIRLATPSAPVGRPLGDGDLVEVTVDLGDAPIDDTEARRATLLTILDQAWAQGGAPTADDLAGILGVSRSTILRDMSALRADGHDVRTRGSRAS